MRIAFSINGEGNGHFSRAVALAEILRDRHEISFWAPEHLGKELRERFPGSAVHRIPYFAFVQNGFSVDYPKTIQANAGLVFGFFRICSRIVRELRQEGVEALVSDFEPFASRSAKVAGIPVLQLNHPGVVLRTLSFSPQALIARAVSRFMMAQSDRTIICSFFDGDVGPILRRELRERAIENRGHVVVYLKPLYRELLLPLLDRLGRDRFKVFPDPKADYAEALATARALVAPAGHQSISEALALGKPVFAIPVEGQFEQELNARKLRETGFGDWSDYRNLEDRLPEFLSELGGFERAIAESRGREPGKYGASCRDETSLAADLVEHFCVDSQRRPEWKRRPLLASMLFNGLY